MRCLVQTRKKRGDAEVKKQNKLWMIVSIILCAGLFLGWHSRQAFIIMPGNDGFIAFGGNGYLEMETDNVLNVAGALSEIGTASITGVRKAYFWDYSDETFADRWVMGAAADTEDGIWFNEDFILDSLGMLSTFGTGDTVIVTAWLTTANATVITGPDTLTSTADGWQTIDLTGIAAASRDIDNSDGSRLAIFLDEHGTVTNAGFAIWGRSYDVQ